MTALSVAKHESSKMLKVVFNWNQANAVTRIYDLTTKTWNAELPAEATEAVLAEAFAVARNLQPKSSVVFMAQANVLKHDMSRDIGKSADLDAMVVHDTYFGDR